jgi:hypothetical protein
VWDGVDWVHLSYDKVQWRALVKTVVNLRVPLKERNFFQVAVLWVVTPCYVVLW